jgi:hypothetical protein
MPPSERNHAKPGGNEANQENEGRTLQANRKHLGASVFIRKAKWLAVQKAAQGIDVRECCLDHPGVVWL